MPLVVRLVDVVVLLWLFVLLRWWGPLVDVDDAAGDVDAVGMTVCAVAVSTLGLGPGGWRWWRLFASRAGVFGDAVGWGALGDTLCRGRGGGDRGVVGDGTSARCWCPSDPFCTPWCHVLCSTGVQLTSPGPLNHP